MATDKRSAEAGTAPGANKPHRWVKPVAGLVLMAGALTAGFLVGVDSVDPTKSEAYLALEQDKATVQSERDSVQQELDEYVAATDEREAQLEERSQELDSRASELEDLKEELEETEAELKEREKAVGKAEAEKEANTVTSGVWTVGVDIKAGTYRADEQVSDRCYWAVLKTGTNGDIIDNGIPGGGRPSVTVRKGQDLELSNCGSWTKQ